MSKILKITRSYLALFLCGLGAAYAGSMGPVKSSNWYLGLMGSALWSNVPSNLSVNNGQSYPYNLDDYSLSQGTAGSLAINAGREWQQTNFWFPRYALGLQYEHFFLSDIKGAITQYRLPQFLNYSYSWSTSADVLSVYGKINLLRYKGFSPFLNVGLGWAATHAGVLNEVAFAGVTPRLAPGFGTHTQNNFAYDLGAGIDYALSPQWSLSLAYRYQNLGTLRSSTGRGAWFADNLVIKNYQMNMLSVGAAYHFA